jgi:hypothetical protein
MNGNVSEAGITEDLAWMERVGIGGVQNFEGSLDTPQVVDERVPYRSQAWREAMRHAVETARDRGIEFTIAASPGWSETGGPWVKPEAAMKKLVWSEIEVAGGKALDVTLPLPPSATGPFGEIPGNLDKAVPAIPSHFYRDSQVIAFKRPPLDTTPKAAISSSSPIDLATITDGDRTTAATLEFGSGTSAWIQFSYDTPQTMRAAVVTLKTLVLGPLSPLMPKGSIAASDDGKTFRTIATLPTDGATQQTLAFPATRARHFRLVLEPGFAPIAFNGRSFQLPPGPTHSIMEVSFQTGAHVDRFEDKAGFTNAIGVAGNVTPDTNKNAVVSPVDVVDLTDRMTVDGRLVWTPPAGNWRIVRFGWSLTGKTVHPASAEGAGLEVDKLNSAHVRAYVDAYLAEYSNAVGPGGLGANGIGFMLNDSFEAGPTNWTDDILQQFEARRHYDPLPFLPVLTGRVVQSAEASDRFLWDFRRTLADLVADAHYGEISRALKEHGMGRYSESHEGGRNFVGDGMEVKKSATVPMGAAWAEGKPPRFMPDIVESASVSHLYGQNIVAAEAFTVSSEGSIAGGPPPALPYGMAPEHLKPLADAMLANGLNRFVVHTSVHQPTDAPGPGVTLGLFGQWFTRKETWADMAGAWVSYLARSSEMLQQGKFVADIAWFYGEDDNITALFNPGASPGPEGFAFDFVNADALRSLLTVEQGKLVAPHGAAYRVLVLDPSATRMTLTTLQKIAALVEGGATVAGAKPVGSPSLADDAEAFRRLADGLWATGKIYPTLDAALKATSLVKDAEFPGAESIAYVHRRLPDADIYFVANLSDDAVTTTGRFRVVGRAPQIWRADDASIRDVSFTRETGITEIPINLAPRDAFFVVFERPTAATSHAMPKLSRDTFLNVVGPWDLQIPRADAEPIRTSLDELVSWTHIDREEIRYFSGVATYTTTFEAAGDPRMGERFILDLGSVSNVARVSVNGRDMGVVWKTPFELDVTAAMRTGENTLTVEVANLWPNRFIGDKQPNAPHRSVFGTRDTFTAASPLLPSGLLGPVRLIRETRAPG